MDLNLESHLAFHRAGFGADSPYNDVYGDPSAPMTPPPPSPLPLSKEPSAAPDATVNVHRPPPQPGKREWMHPTPSPVLPLEPLAVRAPEISTVESRPVGNK